MLHFPQQIANRKLKDANYFLLLFTRQKNIVSLCKAGNYQSEDKKGTFCSVFSF